MAVTHISKTIEKALTELVDQDDTPSFIGHVACCTRENKVDRQYIILGKQKFYLVPQFNFPQVTTRNINNDGYEDLYANHSIQIQSYDYKNIEKLLSDKDRHNLIAIKLDNEPNEIILVSWERDQLIKALTCYWQIDYMNRNLHLKTLYVEFDCHVDIELIIYDRLDQLMDKHEIGGMADAINHANPSLTQTYCKQNTAQLRQARMLPFALENHCESGYYFAIRKDYRFLLNKGLRKSKDQRQKYSKVINGQCTEIIEARVSEVSQIDHLDCMPDEIADLKERCLNYIMSTIQPEQIFFVVESKPYMKKMNLTGDEAQWKCWFIQFRIKNTKADQHYEDEKAETTNWYQFDLFVTALRRKFIPPLMECYQDIIISSTKKHLVGIEDDKLSLDLVDFRKHVHEKCVDSINFNSSISPTHYKQILMLKTDALLMDEDTMRFFQEQLDIRPRYYFMHAILYMQNMIQKLKKIVPQKYKQKQFELRSIEKCLRKIEDRENFKTQAPNKFEHLKELRDMAKIRCDMVQPAQSLHDENFKYTHTIKKALLNNKHEMLNERDNQSTPALRDFKYDDKALPHGGQAETEDHWPVKVARYLAFCVNGGLMSSCFTLQTLVQYMFVADALGESSNDLESLQNEIAYLLQLREIDKPRDKDDHNFAESFVDRITEYEPQSTFYNEKVMLALIDTGYILKVIQRTKEQLPGNKLRGEYPRFLAKLLQTSLRTSIKKACCRQIIAFFHSFQEKKQYGTQHGRANLAGTGDKFRVDKTPMDAQKKQSIYSDLSTMKIEQDEVQFYLGYLVDPLTQTLKSDNLDLANLALACLVNMSQQDDKMKEQFLNGEGTLIVLEFLKYRNEEILVNTLRLVHVLVQSNENHWHRLVKENDQEIVKSLFQILNGPGLTNASYSKRVIYFTVLVLRKLIRLQEIRQLIIDHRRCISVLRDLVMPERLQEITKNLEIEIYQFLRELVEGDGYFKAIVGEKMFYKVFKSRLTQVNELKRLIMIRDNEHELEERNRRDTIINEALLYIEDLTDDCERHFFILIQTLTMDCPKNRIYCSEILQQLSTYRENIESNSLESTTSTIVTDQFKKRQNKLDKRKQIIVDLIKSIYSENDFEETGLKEDQNLNQVKAYSVLLPS